MLKMLNAHAHAERRERLSLPTVNHFKLLCACVWIEKYVLLQADLFFIKCQFSTSEVSTAINVA